MNDPALGQFLSPDTLVPDAGLVLDYNRYMYARGNPLKYTDPTGHTPYFDSFGGGGYGTKESMAAMGTAMALYVATYSLTVDQSLWEGPYVTPRSYSTPQDRPFETPQESAPTVMDTPLLGPEPRPDYATPGNSATTFQTDGLLEGYSLTGQRSAQDLIYRNSGSSNLSEIIGGLPADPTNLGEEWHDVTPAGMSQNTRSREFVHTPTGLMIRFDPAQPRAFGFEGKSHYHVYNPGSTGRHDQYLDVHGNPVRRGSNSSHIIPR